MMKRTLCVLLAMAMLLGLLPLGAAAADKTPADFGWYTDNNNFSGWTSNEDGTIFTVSFDGSNAKRMWKPIIEDPQNFEISLDVDVLAVRAYVQVLGLMLELNPSGGNGNQIYSPDLGNWFNAVGQEASVTLKRANGGDLSVTYVGKDGDTVSFTKTPRDGGNTNLELGVIDNGGSASFANISLGTVSPEEPPVTVEKSPAEFGWYTDNNNYAGWVANEDGSVYTVAYTGSNAKRMWKPIISDPQNFEITLDVDVLAIRAYVQVLGLMLELNPSGGNGDQIYSPDLGNWFNAVGQEASVTLKRVNGGDLSVTYVGKNGDTVSFTKTPRDSANTNLELGVIDAGGSAKFSNIFVDGVGTPVEPPVYGHSPAEFGWYTDDDDFTGWTTDETGSVYNLTYGNGGNRMWKSLLANQDTFTLDLDVDGDASTAAYIQILGVIVELNATGGNGDQAYIKVGGVGYDWLDGSGCKFHVNVTRENGSDLTVTVTGAGNANAFTATATPAESNENVELGLYRGISRFENITVVSESEPEGPVVAEDLVFRNKTLSLQSYIAFNITARNSVLENYDSWYVVFERYDHLSGAVVTETVESVPYGTSYQLFEYKVSSYMMADSITATLYAVKDGVTYKGETYTDSVENFVISRMAAAADSSADMATLYANLLTYGAKAQTFLGYNTEALADAKLGEYASFVTATAPTAENLYAETSNGLTGATKNKLALGISSAVQIQLRINLKSAYDVNTVYGELTYIRGTETITQRIDGKDFTKSGSRYVLIFDAITAVDGRTPVQITIYDQNGNAISETWTYSISSYLVDGGLSGNGLATMEALLNYFDAAAKVFG